MATLRGRSGALATPVLVAALQVAACARTGFQAPPDPCAEVDCGGHGRCAAEPGAAPRCSCDPGFRLHDATTCVADSTALDAGGTAVDASPDASPGRDRAALDGDVRDAAAVDGAHDAGGGGDAMIADRPPAEVAAADGPGMDATTADGPVEDAELPDAPREDSAAIDGGGVAPWAPGLQAWGYRKRLRVPARAPAAQLVDFPLPVLRDDADLRERALDSGFDLRFVDAAGNLLVHQRQRFDGASGALVAWVRLPVLDSSRDTILYLYYGGDPSSPDPSSSAAWSADHLAVWHLDEIATGAAGEFVDSTGHGHHASSASAVPAALPTRVAGQLEGAQDLDGIDDLITTGSSLLDGLGSLTLSVWTSVRVAGGGLVGQNDALEMGFYWPDRLNVWAAGLTELCPGKGVISVCTPDFPLDTWFLTAVTWDGAELALFVDGVERHRLLLTGLNSSGDPFNIGGAIFEPSGGLLDGVVDEVRLASVARSPAWLALEHASLASPEGFVLFGVEEARP